MTASTPASFDDRFAELAAIAHRVAHRLLGSRSDAEDVAQESLARAYARWPKVEPHAAPWVARVASNLALDLLRTRARRRRLDEQRAARPVEGISADGLRAVTERAELVTALGRLPRRQREVVVLRYVADRSEAETAQVLGMAVGTVKRHAHRGLAALRSDLAVPPTDEAPGAAMAPGPNPAHGGA